MTTRTASRLAALVGHLAAPSRWRRTDDARTKLIIFGSPTAGTPVMVAAPLAALDLPLRRLVWEDSAGSVSVSYNSPSYLAERHHLSDEMRARFEPIEAISDALVSVDT